MKSHQTSFRTSSFATCSSILAHQAVGLVKRGDIRAIASLLATVRLLGLRATAFELIGIHSLDGLVLLNYLTNVTKIPANRVLAFASGSTMQCHFYYIMIHHSLFHIQRTGQQHSPHQDWNIPTVKSTVPNPTRPTAHQLRGT